MEESEKENLFATFKGVIESIIIDKRRNPKNDKMLDNFRAKLNMGLQTEKDFYLWVNLTAENGKYTIGKGKLEEYDLEIMATPEDLMGFSSGENSTLHMMLKKNKFGFIETIGGALNTVSTNVDGVFAAGACTGPSDLEDCISAAGAAAMKSISSVRKAGIPA